MNSNKTDRWFHISSTVAVLIGVALVGLEIRQNSELTELQILKQDAESANDRSVSILPQNINEIRQKSFDEPENLTHAEYRALDSFYWYLVIARWRSLYNLAERGLLDEGVWQRQVEEDARIFLGYPFGRAYWERLAETAVALPPDLVDTVDSALADAPEDFPSDAYADVLRRLRTKK